MRTIYIKKYYDEDTDTEYIEPSDVFKYYEEVSEKGQYYYSFLCRVQEYVQYYNTNTSTAFGNPDYAQMGGIVLGWCLGAKWQYIETKEKIEIRTQKGYVVMVVERPKKSSTEIDKQKEINQMWAEILG